MATNGVRTTLAKDGGARRWLVGARPGAVILAAASTACTAGAPSVLDPRGPAAERVTGLWWLMLGISGAVFAVVLALLVAALRRSRTAGADPRRKAAWGEPLIFGAGVVASAAILAAVFLVSLREEVILARLGEDASLTVEVVAHDWWWEARYEGGAITANEIHIPSGEPVRLRLATADVIHSFWVPQLGPKVDMIPGRDNDMWLEAGEPGRYRGQCAEFCGLQHANMIVYVVAQEPSDFERWLREEAQLATEVTGAAARGKRIFESSACAGCHTIRGTSSHGRLGPDLTHLARRKTIAAGVLPNTPEALEHWIIDPQDVKPGVTMPPVDLPRRDLDDLISYLQALK